MQDLAFATARLKKFPFLIPLLEPVPVTVENYGSVPRVYILPRDDLVIPPSMARKIIAMNPPNEVYEIDGDHSLFFSAVDDVERILLSTTATYDS